MKIIGKLIGTLVKMVSTLVFLVVLFGGFMYVTTGSVSVNNFFSEFQNDYRDLNLNRPPKVTEFTRMMDTSSRLGGKDNKAKDKGKDSSVLSEIEYSEIITDYANNLNKKLISLPEGQKQNKKLFTINFSDKEFVRNHAKIVSDSRNGVKQVTENYNRDISGKQIPDKYSDVNKLILSANEDFNVGLVQFSEGIESEDNKVIYSAVERIYIGKDKINEVTRVLDGIK